MGTQLITTGTQIVELHKQTVNSLLEIYKPQSIKVLKRKLNSPTDLVLAENNTPSLAYISKKLNNPDLAVNLVTLHLIEFSDFLNVSRPMTMPQIKMTAELIVDTFPTLKIADLIYTFKQAAAGKFGPLYESIDGTKICAWIEQVLSERSDAGERSSVSEHGEHKKQLIGMVGNNRQTGGEALRELIHNSLVMEQTGKIERKEPL